MKVKKENTAIAEMLMVEGLDCRGFGNIYQFVMKDPELHIYAKALYAFLCSYSGGGTNPYPKRDTITENLMAKSSYYKYLQQLIDNGYIRLKKAKTFPFKTTYILLSNPKKLQEYINSKPSDGQEGNRLHITGLKSEGYGNIPRVVMLDSRLTPQAKAIYAYLRSLSGMGNVAFPSIDTILKHLQIGRSTYNRHFAMLLLYNYIECVQRHIHGRFAGNDYYIIENPDEAAVRLHSHRIVSFRTSDEKAESEELPVSENTAESGSLQHSQIWDTEEQDIEKQDTAEWDTINNTVTNNSSFIKNKSYQSRVKRTNDRGIAADAAEKKKQTKQEKAIEQRDSYAQIIRENIDYDCLKSDGDVSDYLDLMVDVMLDTVTSSAEFHRINGQEMPHEVVKSRLLGLDSAHVEYVVSCLLKLSSPIQNLRAYLLTSLYNAPASIDAYITQDLRAAGVIG